MTAPVTLDKLARQMSPVATDTLDFSRLFKTQATLDGKLEISQCQRLAGELADTSGQIEFHIGFMQDDAGINVLRSEIKTSAQLICQRCLQPMVMPLEVKNLIAVVQNVEQAQQLPDHYEVLVMGETESNLLTLIEDDLLLALPFSPAHDADECQLAQKWVPEQDQSPDRQNPFASLADWQVNKQE